MGTETALDQVVAEGGSDHCSVGKEGKQMSTGAGRRPSCKCSKLLKLYQISDTEAIRMCEDVTCTQFLTSPLSSSLVERPSFQVLLGKRSSRSVASQLTSSSASSTKSLSRSVPLPPVARPDITRSWVARHNPARNSDSLVAAAPKSRKRSKYTFLSRPPSVASDGSCSASSLETKRSGCDRTQGGQRQWVGLASSKSSTSASVCLVPGKDSALQESASSRPGSDCGSVAAASVSSTLPWQRGGLPARPKSLSRTSQYQSSSICSLPESLSATRSGSVSSNSSQSGGTATVNGTGLDKSGSTPSGSFRSISEILSSLGSKTSAVSRPGVSNGASQGNSTRPVISGLSHGRPSTQPSGTSQRTCGKGPQPSGVLNSCRGAWAKSNTSAARPQLPELTPLTVLPLHEPPFPVDTTTLVHRQQGSRWNRKAIQKYPRELVSAPAPALPQPPLRPPQPPLRPPQPPLRPPQPPLRSPHPRPQLRGWTPVGGYQTSRWSARSAPLHPPTRPISERVLAQEAAEQSLSKTSLVASATNGLALPSTTPTPSSRPSSASSLGESEKIIDLRFRCFWQKKTAKDFAAYPLKGSSRAEVESNRDLSAVSSHQSSRSPTHSLGSTGSQATSSSSGSAGRSQGRKRPGSGRAQPPSSKKRKAPGQTHSHRPLSTAEPELQGASSKPSASQTSDLPAVTPAAAEASIEVEDVASLLASAPAVELDSDAEEFLADLMS